MMQDLNSLFSPAKIEVLSILYEARTPLSLRSIASLASVSLRPVQIALKDLRNRRVLKRQRLGQNTFYQIESLPTPLQAFFDELRKQKRERARTITEKSSKSLGPFQEDAFRMLQERKS